jgi:2-methylcitrate dehydratase
MDELTRRLAEYAASLSFDELSAEVVRSAQQRIVDTLAAAIAGRDSPQTTIGRRLASGVVPVHYAGRILLWNERSLADSAAFVNTTMIRNVELNDAIEGGHPSDMLGALLALVEAAAADGRRLLTALVVAYEVFMRINEATRLRRRGWDQGYAIGLGTAAGVGSLLRLSTEKIADGIAITSVGNVPMRATRAGKLSLWKGAASAYAVRNAVFGVLLAADGMTGPDQPIEGRHGLWDQITGPFELGDLGGRGGDFRMLAVRQKYWPVEGGAQGMVWAAQELRALVNLDDIQEIIVTLPWPAWHEIASEPEKWDPKTRETADHSLPYILSRALVNGAIDVAAFEPSAYLDPSLRPLMAKIKGRTDETIDSQTDPEISTRLVATTILGQTHTIEIVNAVGHPLNPMQDADTTAKFDGIAQPVYGPRRTRELLTHWWEVANAETLTPALDLLDFPHG